MDLYKVEIAPSALKQLETTLSTDAQAFSKWRFQTQFQHLAHMRSPIALTCNRQQSVWSVRGQSVEKYLVNLCKFRSYSRTSCRRHCSSLRKQRVWSVQHPRLGKRDGDIHLLSLHSWS